MRVHIWARGPLGHSGTSGKIVFHFCHAFPPTASNLENTYSTPIVLLPLHIQDFPDHRLPGHLDGRLHRSDQTSAQAAVAFIALATHTHTALQHAQVIKLCSGRKASRSTCRTRTGTGWLLVDQVDSWICSISRSPHLGEEGGLKPFAPRSSGTNVTTEQIVSVSENTAREKTCYCML